MTRMKKSPATIPYTASRLRMIPTQAGHRRRSAKRLTGCTAIERTNAKNTGPRMFENCLMPRAATNAAATPSRMISPRGKAGCTVMPPVSEFMS